MALESWQWTSIILCGFGLFKEFRPSEPFLTPYLLDYYNVTQDELVHKAYPAYTYTYLATLFAVFLLTDFVRYRPVVILEAIAYVVTWVLLSFARGLLAMIFVEILYGVALSTEVAYFTYIYAKVDREHYSKVTSYTYSALFAGRFLGGVVSQLLVQFDLMNYLELNYVSLGSVSVALGFSFCLPAVNQSIYFHRNENATCSVSTQASGERSSDTEEVLPSQLQQKKLTLNEKLGNTKRYMMQDLKSAYSNSYVLKWSLWWAVATSGHLIVLNFVQPLWETIVKESGKGSTEYNGAVEATHTLVSTILAFGVGHVKISWRTWGELLLAVSALIQGGLLVWTSKTDSVLIAYICYVIFRILFQVIITVASAEIAQRISDDSFGLIFGINTFVALVIQTILTLVVADEAGFAMTERDQFLVYGIYFGVLGAAFVISLMFTLCLGSQSEGDKTVRSTENVNTDVDTIQNDESN